MRRVVVLIGAGLFCGCAESDWARRERMAISVATDPAVPSKTCEALESVSIKFMAGSQVATSEIALREVVTQARYVTANQGGNFLRLDPLRAWTQTDHRATWIFAEANGTAYHCPPEGGTPSAQLSR
jgi:hypothetical protein